ncbi:hypothetical protein PZH39_16005, partial [Desulfovibrio desulfuricans]|nr:hypothetical protein [Desulfovibrio desulfuricans]
QAVWLGKGCAGLALLVLAQVVFLPAAVVFLGQELGGPLPEGNEKKWLTSKAKGSINAPRD